MYVHLPEQILHFCLRRTNKRLRELGFPTVPQVQLSLADFQEDPLEACQQWAQAVDKQLEARTRAEAEALASKARDSQRVTRSPFSTAGLIAASSLGFASAKLSFLSAALKPQQLAGKPVEPSLGLIISFSTPCLCSTALIITHQSCCQGKLHL